MLTSALTVLEIQFEGAERENKRIRNAGTCLQKVLAHTSQQMALSLSSSYFTSLIHLHIRTSAFDLMYNMISLGRTADTAGSGPSRAAVTLAETVKVWRGITSHRLMGSMHPLPAAAATPRTSRPHIPIDQSALNNTEQSVPPAIVDLEPGSASASALCTYR